jgi:hypothetical protein
MEALTVTAALGNFRLEDLVATAAWALARNEGAFKDSWVRNFVYRGNAARPSAPAWRRTVREKLHGLARRIRSLFL